MGNIVQLWVGMRGGRFSIPTHNCTIFPIPWH